MITIAGYQKTTLLDYPGKLAAVVFLPGCNFRCPFCHNSELFVPETVYTEEEVLGLLARRRGVLEGVAVTGGEPTLSPELPDFLKKLKDLGFLVKLDSNGTRPAVLRHLLEQGLTDYIAMDIKSSREHYGEVAGRPALDLAPIEESIALLTGSGIDYEFRTTVVPELHEDEDFIRIGEWLRGPSRYFLQGYRDSEAVLERRFSQPTLALMEHLRQLVLPDLPNTAIRGVE